MKQVQEKNKKLMEDMGWTYSDEYMGWVAAHLVEETGEVIRTIKHLEHPGYKERNNREATLERLEDELCDVIGLCARIGVKYNLDLEKAMENNHKKIREKLPRGGV